MTLQLSVLLRTLGLQGHGTGYKIIDFFSRNKFFVFSKISNHPLASEGVASVLVGSPVGLEEKL